MSSDIILTERELSIMHVFWEMGQATIADAHETLKEQGDDLAYTSVATIVRILEEKGVLEITRDKRPFLYRPLYDFRQMSKTIVDDIIDRLFDGSRSKLLVQLVEDEALSKKEVAAIKKLLEERKK